MVAGRFHVSAATLDGRRWLRLVISNPGSDEATIEALLDTVETTVRTIGAGTSKERPEHHHE